MTCLTKATARFEEVAARLQASLRESHRDLEDQIARQGRELADMMREAQAPAPGVRVKTPDGSVTYPAAVRWAEGWGADGSLAIYGPGDVQLATFDRWDSVERLDARGDS